MKKRIICIVTALLIMIPAGLSYAGNGLLSGFPTSTTVGDSVTYTISPSDEAVTEADISVSPSSGVELSVSGLSVTATFTEAGTYTFNAKAGDDSDSCSVTVSEAEDPAEEPSGDTSGDTSEDMSGDASDDSSGSTSDGTSKESSAETSSSESAATSEDQKDSRSAHTPKAGKGKAVITSSARAGVGSTGGSTSERKTTYQGSADNYLESLTVDGYTFTQAFHKTRNTYFITAEAGLSSLDVAAEPSDDSADVVITGADNFSEGRNKVMVSVTADNGDVRVYRIYVDVAQ